MEFTLLILEIIGTIAFAVSGAMTALTRQMDIFGVTILGLTTAVGGGAIRDIILGRTPPAMFTNPLYALLAAAASVAVFLPSVRRFLTRRRHVFDTVLLWMDSLGLGAFTVAGIQTAMETNADGGVFLLVFVGVITGVGGGVLRDVLAGNTPYIFVKHVYACASLAGALLCVLLWRPVGGTAAMLAGAAAVVALRLLAAHFRWSLPRAQ
ncbi:MAG: trimeric intracellular cation channel family protein [Eubacteriales bacterium]